MDHLQVLITGCCITLLAAAALVAMIKTDLAPALSTHRTEFWLVLGLLGAGVFMFALKLVVLATLHTAPEDFFRSIMPKPVHQPVSTHTGNGVLRGPSSNFYQSGYQWQALPDTAPYPTDNPPTPEKASLGERLFFDKNLSWDRTVACASCHDLTSKAGADGLAVSEGIGGQRGDRNAPTVYNTGFQAHLFWDGRAASLEAQALQPFLNPIEMGMPSTKAIVQRVNENPEYTPLFAKAFGQSHITIDQILMAIASFERTLITNDTPYDAFVGGDRTALTDQQLNGMHLFEDVGCVLCHSGPNFSSASLLEDWPSFRLFPINSAESVKAYDLVENNAPKPWRVPSLRNVALTGPWFHNGSVDNLHEAVKIMATTQLNRQPGRTYHWATKKLTVSENPPLTDSEVDAIVAFLHALSSRQLAAHQGD